MALTSSRLMSDGIRASGPIRARHVASDLPREVTCEHIEQSTSRPSHFLVGLKIVGSNLLN